MMKSSMQSGTATCGAESHPTAPHLFITQLSGVAGKGGCFLIEQQLIYADGKKKTCTNAFIGRLTSDSAARAFASPRNWIK